MNETTMAARMARLATLALLDVIEALRRAARDLTATGHGELESVRNERALEALVPHHFETDRCGCIELEPALPDDALALV